MFCGGNCLTARKLPRETDVRITEFRWKCKSNFGIKQCKAEIKPGTEGGFVSIPGFWL